MNEPYTPFEPQIGATPKSDEKRAIGTETTNPSIKFESGKTHAASTTDEIKIADRATLRRSSNDTQDQPRAPLARLTY